jgi:pilus assembly protein CpaC
MSASKLMRNTILILLLGAVTGLPAATGVEDLHVTLGKSIVIDYPTNVSRISTSNPDVVDAVAVSTREILLHAKAHGVATVVVWAKNGERNFYNISVEHNLEPIRRIIEVTFPDEPIHVESAEDSVTLTGTVSSQDVSDRAAAVAASLATSVVNNLHLTETVEKQILLRVVFAEMDRKSGSQFAINLVSTGLFNTPGMISTGQFGSAQASELTGSIPGGNEGTTSEFTISDALQIFAFRPDLNLATFIAALNTEGLLQILAEPNLVTSAGKEASFLVGGEFPVPVLQGGSNAGSVTIQFREFGIRLTFLPELTSNDTIRMYVKPEVSTIDVANAVQFSGFTIPALATRRMETNIELEEGQSFVIGGLLDDRAQATFNKIPGLSSIPILGELFKSRSKSRSKNELIVMVTPEIVEPLNPDDPKVLPSMPMDFLRPIGPDEKLTYDGEYKAEK